MMPNAVSTSKEKRKEKSFIAKKEETSNVDGKPQRYFWLQLGESSRKLEKLPLMSFSSESMRKGENLSLTQVPYF